MSSYRSIAAVLLALILNACGSLDDQSRYDVDPADADFLDSVGYQVVEVLRGIQTASIRYTHSLDTTNLLVDSNLGEVYLLTMSHGCPELDNARLQVYFDEVFFGSGDFLKVYDPSVDFQYSCIVRKIYLIEAKTGLE